MHLPILSLKQRIMPLLEIKCPYTHRLSAVEEAASDSSYFAELCDGN